MNIKKLDKYIFDGNFIKDFVTELDERITSFENSESYNITKLQKSHNKFEDISDDIDSLYTSLLASVLKSNIDISAFNINVVAGKDLDPYNKLINEAINGYTLPKETEIPDIELNIEPINFTILNRDGAYEDKTNDSKYVHFGSPYTVSLESANIADINRIPVVYESIIQTDYEKEGFECYGNIYDGMKATEFNLVIRGPEIHYISLLIDCKEIDVDSIQPDTLIVSYVDQKLIIESIEGVDKITIPITGKFERVE